MSASNDVFPLFQQFLREMFQFDHHELDFGLFKVLRLKRSFIEQFIDGDGEQDLRRIVSRELAAIRSADDADERQWLANRCDYLGPRPRKAWAAVLENLQDKAMWDTLRQAISQAEEEHTLQNTLDRLDRWLQAQQYSAGHLEAQLYNYLLNFFELYYQNGDFGYNSRAANAFKVPYEADYDGADTLFHYRHKDCYYIKTANSFPEVRLDVLGKKLVFRIQPGGDDETAAQNNNKDAGIKLYRFEGISALGGEHVARFSLSRTGTPKAEIYPQILNALGLESDLHPYLWQKDKEGDKPIFKDLGKDHDKTEGGQVKGINQLRLAAEAYRDTLAKHEAFKPLGRNAEERAKALEQDPTANALLQIDKALNRFYVGQDADYFIHKDLHGFLSREKDRFIKNVIFSNLDALLDLRADAATRVIARAFNAVASRIIEFLDATETFQKNLFTLKKKVIDTHWLISLGKIPSGYWPRLLAHEGLRAYWLREFKQAVSTLEQMQALPTLVVDTSLFVTAEDKALIDAILSDPAFDHLDEQTDGLLIHSENWQALNLLQEKFRERIQCIYIDPPYNTGGDGFLYKDSFRHSSWAAMMADRLALAKPLLGSHGVLFASIDDKERLSLDLLLPETFGEQNRLGELIWHNVTDNNPTRVAIEHEYIECYAKSSVLLPSEWKSSLSDVKAALIRVGKELLDKFGDTQQLRVAYKEWYRENKQFLGAMEGYKFIDGDGIYCGSRSVHNPGKEGYRYDVPFKGDSTRPCKQPLMGYRFPWETMKRLLDEGRILFGEDESKLVELKVYAHEYEDKLSSVIALDGRSGANDLRAMFPGEQRFKNPKASALLETIFPFVTGRGDYILDFFAGSGTTAQGVLALNRKDLQNRRFILTEMGSYFDSVLKPRVAKVMHAAKWNDGRADALADWQGIVKVQRFEQYEDVVNNLETAWDEAAMPPGVPLRYLFRPEENRVRQSLNLAQPFSNVLRAGKQGEDCAVDLLETWALLQGYWVRSRKVLWQDGKRYAALETECGCLVLLRDITLEEDDSAAVNAIAQSYANADGSPRIQRLELNHWADLRRIALPCTLLMPTDFDRGADWS